MSDNVEDKVTPQYQHIKELSQLKYEAEEKREQSLIQQASQMQTVFYYCSCIYGCTCMYAVSWRVVIKVFLHIYLIYYHFYFI